MILSTVIPFLIIISLLVDFVAAAFFACFHNLNFFFGFLFNIFSVTNVLFLDFVSFSSFIFTLLDLLYYSLLFYDSLRSSLLLVSFMITHSDSKISLAGASMDLSEVSFFSSKIGKI